MERNLSPNYVVQIKETTSSSRKRKAPYCMVSHPFGSRHSSVSIATRYGLVGPGIESLRLPDFPNPSRQALGPTHPYILGTGSVPVVKRREPGFNHPSQSSTEVEERGELYFYFPSGHSWPVLGWTTLTEPPVLIPNWTVNWTTQTNPPSNIHHTTEFILLNMGTRKIDFSWLFSTNRDKTRLLPSRFPPHSISMSAQWLTLWSWN